MRENFTRFAFTDSVRELQSHYGSRDAYARMEKSGDRFILTSEEVDFIENRDSFYLSTVSENGWPYVQFRGGPVGFLKVLGDNQIGFADFQGNHQYISSGNIKSVGKASLFLMDYTKKERLKIWADAQMQFAEDAPELVEKLRDEDYPAKIERVFTFTVRAYDWNCPKYIPQKYTLDEIRSNPALLKSLTEPQN